ncbi:hypothetical protein CKO25_13830 [Thiocapsa imhoffii]|uniref:Choice-of-anchor A domain-containing protein n=1 Tax=Thiocapsa imhoffii TaxID=382777 RepID=A0A9X1B990_9GAMM|nr:choice-of-anchor A family protein [Thiocapsa imhoffii]MBK1645709.1 hypothetical protein [Thiocapsa imhoffii]
MRFTTTILTTLLLGASVTTAHAALIGPAADYNVFVFGNFTSSNSDTEGNLAAGGNVNLTNYAVASKIPGQDGGRLVAGGHVTATNGGVGDGQNGRIYADSTNLTNFTATGGVQPQTLVDFAAAESLYKGLSTSLAALTANGTTNVEWGSLNLTGTGSGLSVFSVTADQLTNTNSVNITADAGSTVLINVSGSGQIFQNGQVFLNGISKHNVLYNFSEATDLHLAGSKNPYGTILAPFADVTGGWGALDGQLIAQSFDGNIEMHNVLFEGTLPSPVPLPAAVWLFGSALGMMGGIAIKRRQRRST